MREELRFLKKRFSKYTVTSALAYALVLSMLGSGTALAAGMDGYVPITQPGEVGESEVRVSSTGSRIAIPEGYIQIGSSGDLKSG